MTLGGDVQERICDAVLTCVARWGLAKTTLDDVAREAGCSRATIYRTFQGGKAEVVGAVVWREARRLAAAVDDAIAVAGDDPADVLTAGVVAATGFLSGHAALGFLLAHEADAILPHVAFGRLGPVLDIVAEFAVPRLARFVPDPEEAARAAEWLARVVLTYSMTPDPRGRLDDPAFARHLVTTYVLPGLGVRATT